MLNQKYIKETTSYILSDFTKEKDRTAERRIEVALENAYRKGIDDATDVLIRTLNENFLR